MTNSLIPRLLVRQHRQIFTTCQRYVRGPFVPPKRSPEDRNRELLNRYNDRRLKMAEPSVHPQQWSAPPLPPKPNVVRKERKLPSLAESSHPYTAYSAEEIKEYESFGTWFDPNFNPHLHEQRHKINPDEEPYNAIYSDSVSESAKEYTSVRNITTPELWEFVERLAHIRVAPPPGTRKIGEPVVKLPSGFVLPPESPPDLPYFVPRTRSYQLPVYYHLSDDPESCYTLVKQVTGDLWRLEEDLRNHLEDLNNSKRRILTAVRETDAEVLFRGRHLHQVVEWLYERGF